MRIKHNTYTHTHTHTHTHTQTKKLNELIQLMLAMGFTMKNEFENKREIGFQWQGKKQ